MQKKPSAWLNQNRTIFFIVLQMEFTKPIFHLILFHYSFHL